jgi:GalNAc5-diNAcBac-PP-undecaprenol beta-1,3-glucosyltransferase
MKIKATVVIPTHDRSLTLWRSINSVLTQTIENIEIFMIGDGVPDPTRDVAREIQAKDKRVRFFDFPKGDRHGELHRHSALAEACGEIVCYLSDDDLYLPNHIETMIPLLQKADFVNALPILVNLDGTVSGWPVDLSLPSDREYILSTNNLIPLSCGAHTLEMYRQLPYGWRTTPKGIPTDLYMWRQFLDNSNCLTASSKIPTVLTFPDSLRKSLTIEQRCEELDRWSQKLTDAIWQENFVQKVGNVVQSMTSQRAAAI